MTAIGTVPKYRYGASQVGHVAAAVRWHLRHTERFPAMGKARLAVARSVRWRSRGAD
jgi:hypothetical protein